VIVKVQVSLFTTESAQQVLVYNEDRSVMYQGDVTQDILDAMGGAPRRYFFAVINDDNTIGIEDPAPEQTW
jgi:hypothetical protein